MIIDDRRTVSPRIESLRADIMKRPGSVPANVNPFSCTAALVLASGNGKSRVQVRASYLHELVKLAQIEIEADCTLAGQHLPTVHMGLEVPEPDNARHRELLGQLGIPADKIGAVRDCVKQWQNPPRCAVGTAAPESLCGQGNWGGGDLRTVFWA
ncbi:MAG: hypothetical protein NTV86_11480, partial [Planctomycetota bacterium]|nr:hypothetical protein [Planctomycetota bacterium]